MIAASCVIVSETIPSLYHDAVDGRHAHYELYDYKTDPGERTNTADQCPERVQQLRKIWKRDSDHFPKPIEWDVEKWNASTD